MANTLEMARIQAIQQLHAAKWSQRRIARELGIDRGTVARCLRALQSEPKPAIPPTGSEGSKAATFEGAPAPPADRIADSDGANRSGVPKAAIPPTGKVGSADSGPGPSNPPSCGAHAAGRRSDCEPFRALILAKLDQGLSAQRIYQDLTSEHSAAVGYNSVKRFVRRLRTTTPLPFRRMECAAGEEAQVDFGTGARLIGSDGKRRKSYVFRVVLSHSRKGYSEATRRQTTWQKGSGVEMTKRLYDSRPLCRDEPDDHDRRTH